MQSDGNDFISLLEATGMLQAQEHHGKILFMGLTTAQSGCLRWDKILSKEKHRRIIGGTGRNQAGGMKAS